MSCQSTVIGLGVQSDSKRNISLPRLEILPSLCYVVDILNKMKNELEYTSHEVSLRKVMLFLSTLVFIQNLLE